MSLIFDVVGGILYYVLLGTFGVLLQLLNVVVSFWTYLWRGTSVVNFSGSGPNFDIGTLGLNLARAFGPTTLTKDPMDITERDVALSNICKLAYETDAKRKTVFTDWIQKKYVPQMDLDSIYQSFSYTSFCTNYLTFLGKGVFRTNAFVLRATVDSVVICFRGTQPFDLFQWFTDASLVQHPIVYGPETAKPIYIHRGFLAALGLDAKEGHVPPKDNMLFKVLTYVADLMFTKDTRVKNVYITGHSLGAALAQQFAFALRCSSDLIRNWHPKALDVGKSIRGVYTFGTPRSGNAEFVQSFNEGFDKVIVHRVVNNDDVVGRVPFNGIHFHGIVTAKFEYRATDTLIYLLADHNQLGAQCIVHKPSAIKERPDDHLGFAIGLSSITDHFPSSYCDRLNIVWRAALGKTKLLQQQQLHAHDEHEEKVNNGSNGTTPKMNGSQH